MSEMRIYPTQRNINCSEGNIDKQHLSALEECYSILNLELNKIKSSVTSIEVTAEDFNKIQELKNTLEYVESRIKEMNLKVYGKEFSYIENFNSNSHKNIFSNTDLSEVILSGKHYKLSKWYELTVAVCNHLISIDKGLFEREVSILQGKSRLYFSKNNNLLKRGKPLENTDYFIESNFSSYETVCTCIKILKAFNFEDDVIIIFDNKKS